MKDKRKGKKKPALDLFLRKVKKDDLPERGSTILRRDPAAHKNLEAEMDKLEHELEEIQAPIFKAEIERMGLSIDELKEIAKKEKEIHNKFRKSFGEELERYIYGAGPFSENLGVRLVYHHECKDVTFEVCDQRVCVDQPVPLPVADIWKESGSGGAFTRNGANFNYSDTVLGWSEWNFFYHRRTRTDEGGINIRLSTELVQPATVRQIGITFPPLLDYRGWPLANGIFAIGANKAGRPDSFGSGKMWISFQVSIKKPLDVDFVRQIPDPVEYLYYDRGRYYSRVAQTNTYPPSRSWDLNRNYAAGTQFLIEANLSYWITASGWDASASARYNLEVRPYMNLEACSWEYPEWATVQIP